MVTWHLLEDVLGWVAVLIVSVVMLFADVSILDPLLSVLITVWVGINAARNLKRTMDVFLQAVPDDVDVDALCEMACGVEGVVDLRHVHVWSQEGEHHVLTGHLVVDCDSLERAETLREQVRRELRDAGIEHVTLEVVSASRAGAADAACG